MEEGVARTETKYALDEATAARLRAKLDMVMQRDGMGGPYGYMVRSLYFDTPFDQDYHDKIDGFESRRKIRLRIYNPADEKAKLELKRKIGKYQWKKSLTVSKNDAMMLMECRYAELKEKLNSTFAKQLLTEMEHEVYTPKTVIEFRRLAYVTPIENTRVTFDTRLTASQSLLDLFAANPSYHPILHPAILEVKYTNILASHIKTVLQTADQLPLSVSKYCLGRQISFY